VRLMPDAVVVACFSWDATPTRRFTFGYGKSEDVAGVVILLLVSGQRLRWLRGDRPLVDEAFQIDDSKGGPINPNTSHPTKATIQIALRPGGMSAGDRRATSTTAQSTTTKRRHIEPTWHTLYDGCVSCVPPDVMRTQ